MGEGERQKIRREFAAEIIAALKEEQCEPGEGCADRFCPDCIEYHQALRYIAMIQKMI